MKNIFGGHKMIWIDVFALICFTIVGILVSMSDEVPKSLYFCTLIALITKLIAGVLTYIF
jgi:hypothetical protein